MSRQLPNFAGDQYQYYPDPKFRVNLLMNVQTQAQWPPFAVSWEKGRSKIQDPRLGDLLVW